MFSKFSQWISHVTGKPWMSIVAFLLVILWLLSGPYFQYSETWQLFINTTTTIITFLMVFLIQHTQNRDTQAVHLKLDEIIRSIAEAHNDLVNIEHATDEELENLSQKYEEFVQRIKTQRQKTGTPEV